MKKVLQSPAMIYVWGMLYVLLAAFFIWKDLSYFALGSVGLLMAYFAVFQTEKMFLALAFFTPLSVNIEEWTEGLGMFLPTEPLLFGLLVFILMMELRRPLIPKHVWRHPIVISAGVYCVWLLLTTITSEHPLASFKFLIAKLWFFVPMLLLGPVVFAKEKNIRRFVVLFVAGLAAAVIYTILHHAQYGFGEKEGHWVMFPFFKDHTIYGATVALGFMLILGLYFSKKQPPLTVAILLLGIVVIGLGLYFSYTRAAWLSVIGSMVIGLLIKLQVKFSYLAGLTVFVGALLFVTWDDIQMELERNKQEHTTEDFAEKLQSATNVTTDASNLERLNRWACAWEMFKSRPVVGFGPGTYAFEYARFQQPENLTIISTNFGDAGNAHSEYLGPLCETGLPGLICVLTLITFLFYRGIMLYNRLDPANTEWRTFVLFLIMAVSTYFIHGFLNNYLDTDKAAVPIWGMAAMFIALEQRFLSAAAVPKRQG